MRSLLNQKKLKSLLRNIKDKRIYDDYIKGKYSFIAAFILLNILIFVGFNSPSFFEIIYIKSDSLNDISSNLLSAYVGTLGIALAISAIIFAILQMANRKIQINEIVFRNSFFAPTVFFGIFNVAILIFLQLFNSQEKLFNSTFVLVRLLVIENYLFILLCFFISFVFYKVFRYLDFSIITTEYIKEILVIVKHEKNGSLKEIEKQKIAQKGKEIIQELSESLQKEDHIIWEKFLECLFLATKTNSTSNLLMGVPFEVRKWIVFAVEQDRIHFESSLYSFWVDIVIHFSSLPNSAGRGIYLGMPSQVYKLISHKKRRTIAYDFSLRLKEVAINKIYNLDKKNIAEVKSVYAELDFILSDFNLLVRAISDERDKNSLLTVTNELKLLLETDNILESVGTYEVKRKLEEKNNDAFFDDPEIPSYLTELNKDLVSNVKGISFGVYSFLFYEKLYHNKKEIISSDIINVLKQQFLDTYTEPFELFLFLSNTKREYHNWEDWIWNLEERLNGQVYTLPSKYDVLLTGLLSLFLEDDLFRIMPSDDMLQNKSFTFIISRSIELLDLIIAQSNNWITQFNSFNKFSFEEKVQSVKQHIQTIEKRKDTLFVEKLINTPLSKEKINDFKNLMKTQWEKNQNLTDVFQYFNSIQLNPDKELQRIGFNINFQKAKSMFIDGELYSYIYGLEWGNEISRNKENLLGRRLFEKHLTIKPETNIAQGLNNAIDILLSRNITPNIIISTSDSFYKEELELFSSGNYLPKWKENQEKYPFKYIGRYKELYPIIRIKTQYFKNKFIVAKLEQALLLQQRENNSWIDKRLHIDVEEIDENKARQIFDRRKHEFENIAETKALYEIQSGVIIDIDEICDFEILDENALQIFEISSFASIT